MNARTAQSGTNNHRVQIMAAVLVTILLLMGAATYQLWLPRVRALVSANQKSPEDPAELFVPYLRVLREAGPKARGCLVQVIPNVNNIKQHAELTQFGLLDW